MYTGKLVTPSVAYRPKGKQYCRAYPGRIPSVGSWASGATGEMVEKTFHRNVFPDSITKKSNRRLRRSETAQGQYRMHGQGEAMLTTVAEVETSTMTAAVLKAEWPRPIEHTWSDPHAVITLLFRSSNYEIKGRYGDCGPGRALDRIGQVFFIPPDVELFGWGSGGEVKAARCVFAPGFVERTLGTPVGLTSAQLRNSLDIPGALAPSLLRRLMEEALHPGFAAAAMVESLGSALLIECTRHVLGHHQDNDRKKIGLTPKQRRLIKQYVESQECGAPTISSLASLCGLSERYFCRLFREEMGHTVGQYLKSVQISRAKRYLLTTDLPLKEIAFRLGFANAANFSAAFRTVMNQPPIAFRQQHGM